MLRKLIDRPIAVTMSLIAIIVLGIVATNLLPVSLIPDIDIPRISIQTTAHDYSARELDEAIIKPLRQQLMQIAGLKDIRTESKDGSGTIYLTFEHGADIDYLFIEVNEKIDRSLSSLPKELERPKAIKASATDIPAFYINVSAKGDESFVASNPLYPVSEKFYELSEFAGQVISKRIEQLPEVAMVDISGYVSPEILIIPDREKLHQLGVDLSTLENALIGANIRLGTLYIRDGEYRYNVKFQSDADSRQTLEDIYLKLNNRLYQVKDIATIHEHPQPRTGIVTSDGKNAVTLAVIKQSDAKMSRLKANIDELMQHMENDYPELEFTITRDQTALLDYSINNLIQNIIIGILLACAIIFLFMQNMRSAMLVVITIPISLILSLLVFYAIGLTINIISLAGLVLGSGMMVDNSIIVIDNITYRWNRSESLREATVNGTQEVFAPMLSSVLTTCSVFIPLIFLSGIAGSLFYDQAMAVTITLLTSLLTTVTVIPVYYYLAYRKHKTVTINRFLARFSFDPVIRVYSKGLKWLFRNPWFMWSSFAIVIVGIIFLSRHIEKELLPPITYNDMLVNVDWNEKISVEENESRTRELLETVKDETVQSTVMAGSQQFLLSHTRQTGISEAIIYLKLSDADLVDESQRKISAFIDEKYPEAICSFEPSGNIFDMVFSEQEARLVARFRAMDGDAPKPDALNRLLSRLDEELPDVDIEPILWQEHLLYIAKPELMTLYGVSYSELSAVLKNALNENRLFNIVQGHLSVPVIVGDNKSDISTIIGHTVIRKNNVDIPMSDLMRETRDRDFQNIISGPEGNFYPLNLNIPTKQIPATIRIIQECTSENDEFEVSFSGSYFSNRDMVRELVTILIIAVLLLYFILASQFESLVQPIIILSEIIVDIFGALLVLLICGVSLNIMSLIGLIVMCGIVINDSILKIDTINRLRKEEGKSILHAIIDAGHRRLKPIVMTSLTTILAIAPFLVRGDMGSDLQYPLSVAIIGGMVIGTIVSVYFIPLAYYEIYRRK